nr:PREDICTED: lipase 3-like isoform X2 [Bemisia tabaci]
MFLSIFTCICIFICGCDGARRETTTDEYIRRNGYPLEVHKAETPDGFILTLFRIPGETGATPVYLQHGLVDSSDSWFCMGRNRSIGFTLADAGYDVWAGNFRGNVYSSGHKRLKPEMREYWDFSWDTLGLIDVRVMIQYILQTSGQPDLIHIGHSMGTTSFFVAASSDDQLNQLVRTHIALAPITSFEHSPSPVFSAQFIEPLITLLQSYEQEHQQQDEQSILETAKDAMDALQVPSGLSTLMASLKTYVSPVGTQVAGYAEMVTTSLNRIRNTVPDYLGMDEIIELINLALDRGEVRGSLGRKYCQMSPAHERFCLRVLSIVQGDDEHHLTKELIRLLFRTLPKSSSLKEFLHYLQQRQAGRVFFYDYGTEERNMLEYGSPTPPEVNFGKIMVPVYFVYGPNDLFTSVEDLQASYDKLGNPAGFFAVGRPDWNHGDFLITIDVRCTLTKAIVLDILRKHQNERGDDDNFR